MSWEGIDLRDRLFFAVVLAGASSLALVGAVFGALVTVACFLYPAVRGVLALGVALGHGAMVVAMWLAVRRIDESFEDA